MPMLTIVTKSLAKRDKSLKFEKPGHATLQWICLTMLNSDQLCKFVSHYPCWINDEKRCLNVSTLSNPGNMASVSSQVSKWSKLLSVWETSAWETSKDQSYNAMLYRDQLLNWNCCPKLPKTWPNGARIFHSEKPGHATYQKMCLTMHYSDQIHKVKLTVLTKGTNNGALMSEHCANLGIPACSISFESKLGNY